MPRPTSAVSGNPCVRPALLRSWRSSRRLSRSASAGRSIRNTSTAFFSMPRISKNITDQSQEKFKNSQRQWPRTMPTQNGNRRRKMKELRRRGCGDSWRKMRKGTGSSSTRRRTSAWPTSYNRPTST
uniref:SWI/SNF related, matrix associated, actin dependent regulator of chromatin, subfamily a, member 4 n=1 Tax=Molossus molossus TaxID=27622 RepID=A0A7J8ID14_MOLMO|nr:SWI/SNF related, matrix associated, actin dependent regulator of chromatin, subfamily a, member 4 [Molossus molossus]